MVLSESTTSIRIVSVDHYMHKPQARFDTCYSEFRGCDVKQVPVIRLFGSTSDGVHSCVHIHGVFPYLYVPYDGTGTDRLAVDRFMYQLASGLDKAINVSLGNASSTKSHVFRIALVKGTPIYGYHRKEHLFLKIYLYNPHFIRKATTLLMNGVILSRVFQTYETHIPYILQFFIDYNLYGMSFLRVPTKAICERIDSDAELPKMSTSEYEIDIQAADILNRTTLEQGKQSEYANPGIASIWDDECARRRLLGLEQPVAVSLSQSGKTETVTESDRFYRNVLISKLNEKQRRVSQPSQLTDVKRVKPPVSFYPSEIGDEEQLLDASCIQNHKSFTQMSFANCSNVRFDLFSDSVDEDRIISMSQNPDASFVEEDHELLGIMRELEENENNERDGDSLLAPLTQLSQNRVPCTAGSLLELSQSGNRRLNATLSGNLETVSMMESRTEEGEVAELERQLLEGDLTLDSDDEFLLDYTSKLDLQPELSNEGNLLNASDDDMLMNIIPQLDGAVDDLTLAPIAKRNRSNGTFSDSTAPSVNGVQTNGLEPEIKRSRRSRELKAQTESEPVKRSLSNGGSPDGPLSPRTRKKIRGEQNGLQLINGQSTPEKQPPPKLKELKIRLSKMDFSSYRLPPSDSPQKEPKRDLSPYDEFRLAREYDLANNWDPQEGLSSGTKRGRGRSKKPKPKPAIQQPKPKRRTPFKQRLQPEEIDVVLSQRFQNIIKLSPKVLLKPLSQQEMAHIKEKPAQVAASDTACELANISDKLSRSADSATWSHLSEIPMETNQKVVCSPIAPLQPESEEPEEIEDLNIESFYEKTLAFDDFDEIGSTSDESLTGYQLGLVTGSDKKVAIALQEKPPSFEDALKAVHDFAIPKVVHQEPFYGDPADITGRKEVGHVVLNIGGNSFNDLEEFRSVVPGLSSLNQLRYEKLCSIYGEDIDQVVGDPRSRSGSGKIKELVTSNRAVAIHLAAKPPSKHEAKVWLKAIESIKSEDLAASIEQDSPIKIKKMQAIMVGDDATNMETQSSTKSKIDHDSALNLSSLISADSQLDCSSRKSLVSKIFSMNTTRSSPALAGDQLPASADRLQLPSYSARRKRSKNAGKARLSLSTTFKRLRSATKEEPTSSAFMETSVSEETIAQQPAPLVEDEMDIIASSQARTNSQKSNENGSNQSTLPHSAEIASMKQRLLGEEPMIANDSQTVGDNSGNISATTQLGNTFGFKVNFENLQKAKATCEYNHLAIMSVEIHVQTRGELCPNPEIDPISAMFYRIHNDVPEDHRRAPSVCGIILNREHADGKTVEPTAFKYNKCIYTADVVTVANERELYEKFLMLISFWDPDIFAGYEIEQASWGYIIQRGYALEMNLMKMLSRVPTAEKVHVSEEEEQDLLEMHEYSAGLKIPGRILLDIWRLMRHEIALTSYSFENIVYHILHRRVPRHSFRLLTRLWNKPYSKWIVYEYYLERVNGNLELLQQLDLIGRTAELAKLFGIQFYEVLSRGSQFRVESMMLRIAKPRNFVSLSPSIQQRAHMRAPEYLPLILEPGSRFYADPLIVLDFQSLYPSMIIAYNYCFSTCLGRVEHLAEGESEPFEFGASQLKLSRKLLQFLVDNNLITISPCGVAFVKASVREGVLPRMLNEILTTRLMVKGSMKLHKENRVLQRVLHSRQLGLKLIANVTYGYTAANFSGRMPCVEVGDSVVSKGRETLERAIKMVESTERWGAKVVYGDTDSLFVLCPGRTKEDAFQIGEEIVEAVTRDNPPPVKLKLEKVYQPCILQTKKRYVGYMYETADQEKPVYEAKGIETVRRDGCPVVGKMLEKVLRILFETRDVSKVKEYTCRQFTKILEGRVNLQDFIFAKEFRGEDGYKPGACVPALELTRRWKLVDPRREPRRGERVPYVIVNGPPLVPLIRLVRSPDELLADSGLKINSNYYISKAIIPPLNRCLLLIGADVHQWYNDLPRKFLMLHNTGGKSSSLASALQLPKKSTISQYFSTTSCIGDCGQQTHRGVCDKCLQNPQRTVCYVADKINRLERRVELGEKMCKSCCQRSFETACISLDCPIVFVLNQRKREHDQVQYYRNLVEELF